MLNRSTFRVVVVVIARLTLGASLPPAFLFLPPSRTDLKPSLATSTPSQMKRYKLWPIEFLSNRSVAKRRSQSVLLING